MDRLQDIDPAGNPGMARLARSRARDRGPRARALPPRAARRQGAPLGRLPALQRQHRLPQHDPAAPRGALARRPRARAPPALHRALERHGDGAARRTKDLELGGHIASFASAATLYDVGFNHFWHAPDARTRRRPGLLPGPLARPASTPAPSSRAASAKSSSTTSARRSTAEGLSSYPHPWLMPDFWQFPTVSMGLGPIQAIYQARFLRYLQRPRPRQDRRAARSGPSWATARWTSPSRSAPSPGRAREARQPDLRRQLQPAAARRPGARQRQDHPGAGGGVPRRRLERHQGDLGRVLGSAARRDKNGILLQAHGGGVDGEYQKFKSRDGAYVREHFFGKYPELREMVANMSDDGHLAPEPRRPRSAQGLRRLRRGRASTRASRR